MSPQSHCKPYCNNYCHTLAITVRCGGPLTTMESRDARKHERSDRGSSPDEDAAAGGPVELDRFGSRVLRLRGLRNRRGPGAQHSVLPREIGRASCREREERTVEERTRNKENDVAQCM